MYASWRALAGRLRPALVLAAACALAAVCPLRAESTVAPAPKSSASAKLAAPVPLSIVGESITSLSLESISGRIQRYPIVNGTIALPPGEYAVADVQVAGGWRYNSQHTGPWFKHSADAPARLTLGAPLRGKVQIVPSGRRIDLNFSVVDAEGRTYSGRTPQPPRVEIYAGEKLLDSGTFRYG